VHSRLIFCKSRLRRFRDAPPPVLRRTGSTKRRGLLRRCLRSPEPVRERVNSIISDIPLRSFLPDATLSSSAASEANVQMTTLPEIIGAFVSDTSDLSAFRVDQLPGRFSLATSADATNWPATSSLRSCGALTL
jgi:hypothetical protein